MARLGRRERRVVQEPTELRVPLDRREVAVRLGLLVPKAIPASQVSRVLRAWPDSRVHKVPLAQRAQQGLRELQVLRA